VKLALDAPAVSPVMLARYCSIRRPSAFENRGPRSYSASLLVDPAMPAEVEFLHEVERLFEESVRLAIVKLQIPEDEGLHRQTSPATESPDGTRLLRFKLPEFRTSYERGRRESVPQAPRIYGATGAKGPLFDGEIYGGSRLAAYFTPEPYAFREKRTGECMGGLRLRLDMVAVHDPGTPPRRRSEGPDPSSYAHLEDPF